MFGLTRTKKHTTDLEAVQKIQRELLYAQAKLVELMTTQLGAKESMPNEADAPITEVVVKPKRKYKKSKYFYKEYEPLLYEFLRANGSFRLNKLITFYKSPVKGIGSSTLIRMLDISPRLLKENIKGKGTFAAAVLVATETGVPAALKPKRKYKKNRKSGYSKNPASVYKRKLRAKNRAKNDPSQSASGYNYGVALATLSRHRDGTANYVSVHRMDCEQVTDISNTCLVANSVTDLRTKARAVSGSPTLSLQVCSYCEKAGRLQAV